jgi:hypothetical protein
MRASLSTRQTTPIDTSASSAADPGGDCPTSLRQRQDVTMTIALDADFPRIYAGTDRFRRGMPRTFEVTDDHVTFLRSADAYDATLSLWRLDLATGAERCLVAAADL